MTANDDWDNPTAYARRTYGPHAESMMQERELYQEQFGWWLRKIREATPLDHVRPERRHEPPAGTTRYVGRRMRRVRQHLTQRARHVSRRTFLTDYRVAFEAYAGRETAADESFVKRLEQGEVLLDPLIVASASYALRASRMMAAFLSEAAGYGGLVKLLQQLDPSQSQSDAMFGFLGYIAKGPSGDLTPQDIETLIQALEDFFDDEFKKRGK